jgi:SAM-dependent methyltransferase
MRIGGRVTTLGGFVDAWRGCEGLRYSADDLARFYAGRYLEQHPDLDANDTPEKASLLLDVCARAGVARPPRLLEVGSGSGELLVRIARALGAGEALGADYSESIAAVARARTGLSIVAFDGARLPFADREIDLAYFADVLEHVLTPVPWLREVARVAKKVAMLVPLESGALDDALYAIRRVRGVTTNLELYGHIWRFKRARVEAMLEEAGLRIDVGIVHHRPAATHGMNWKGLALDRVRASIASVLPRAAEAILGGSTYLAVATPC